MIDAPVTNCDRDGLQQHHRDRPGDCHQLSLVITGGVIVRFAYHK